MKKLLQLSLLTIIVAPVTLQALFMAPPKENVKRVLVVNKSDYEVQIGVPHESHFDIEGRKVPYWWTFYQWVDKGETLPLDIRKDRPIVEDVEYVEKNPITKIVTFKKRLPGKDISNLEALKTITVKNDGLEFEEGNK